MALLSVDLILETRIMELGLVHPASRWYIAANEEIWQDLRTADNGWGSRPLKRNKGANEFQPIDISQFPNRGIRSYGVNFMEDPSIAFEVPSLAAAITAEQGQSLNAQYYHFGISSN